MLLTKQELLSRYYLRAIPVEDSDVDLYLDRANAFCVGYIGGVPPMLPGEDRERPTLKTAVALCWEIMARGETKQIDDDTGNITDVAPPTGATKTATQYAAADQFKTVREMLRPFKNAFEFNTNQTDRGVKFL